MARPPAGESGGAARPGRRPRLLGAIRPALRRARRRPGSYAGTLAALRDHLRPTDTLLDVGAGTGRFALPLAPLVHHVTALDHSPAMLDRLRAKQGAAGVTNITTVEADWEEADSAPHDVVLAAWALYRQVDLGAALTRLIAATRRLLVIAVSDSADPPQRAHVRAIWGGDGEPDIPVPLYLLGALRQLGVAANLQMVPETRAFLGPTPADIARRLAPLAASADEVPDLALRLRPQIEERPEGHRSAFTVPAALMTWQRRSRQQAREQRARPGE